MLGAESLRDLAGKRQLAEGVVGEAHGKRLELSRRAAGACRDHHARIDAAAEKGADRHVGNQVHADCFVNLVSYGGQPIVDRQSLVRLDSQLPVALWFLTEISSAHVQDMAGWELLDPLKNAPRPGDDAECQIILQGRGIE